MTCASSDVASRFLYQSHACTIVHHSISSGRFEQSMATSLTLNFLSFDISSWISMLSMILHLTIHAYNYTVTGSSIISPSECRCFTKHSIGHLCTVKHSQNTLSSSASSPGAFYYYLQHWLRPGNRAWGSGTTPNQSSFIIFVWRPLPIPEFLQCSYYTVTRLMQQILSLLRPSMLSHIRY